MGGFSLRRSRPAEESDAERFDEAGRRQRRRQGQQRADSRHQKCKNGLGQLRTDQDGLKDQPFRHKAVERRQCRNGDGPHKKQERRYRHLVDKPSKAVKVAFARRMKNGARPQKQEILEQRMIKNMQQGSRHRHGGAGLKAVGVKSRSQAEADKNDADVLNRGISKKPLKVVLHKGVKNAYSRRYSSDDQDRYGPPQDEFTARQIENNADKAIDGNL